jgi:hypothetical protein
MKTIAAFFLGMAEFRSDCTTNPGDDLIEAYDSGREWAHRLTRRLFEEANRSFRKRTRSEGNR